MEKVTGFKTCSGDFMAARQEKQPVEVWNINGSMCIAVDDDPIYITKEQAKAFFNLTEKQGA